MDYVRQLGSGATCSVWLARRKKKCVVVKRVAAAHLRAGARELAVLHRLRGDSGFVQLLHAERVGGVTLLRVRRSLANTRSATSTSTVTGKSRPVAVETPV